MQHNVDQNGKGLRELIEISSPNVDFIHNVLNAIRNDPNIQEAVIIGDHKYSVLVSIRGINCECCKFATICDQRCYLTSEVVNEQGEIEMEFIAGGKGSLRCLLAMLRRKNAPVHLKSVAKTDGEGPLTRRQEHVIRLAMQIGYFDYPRRANLEQLSTMLNVSPSTISEILRRVETKVLDAYLKQPIFMNSRSKRLGSHKEKSPSDLDLTVADQEVDIKKDLPILS
ncbi:MAG: helix-turn-helix domain-containing protein [Thaumarchaeota archaeon]|nr:helix-turn-helix domain-containing protein [Nitrososphaerota archaeon]